MTDLGKFGKGLGLFALVGFVWFMGFSFAMTGQGYDECTIQIISEPDLEPICNKLEIHMAAEGILSLIGTASIITIALWKKK